MVKTHPEVGQFLAQQGFVGGGRRLVLVLFDRDRRRSRDGNVHGLFQLALQHRHLLLQVRLPPLLGLQLVPHGRDLALGGLGHPLDGVDFLGEVALGRGLGLQTQRQLVVVLRQRVDLVPLALNLEESDERDMSNL